jgi:WD40 repeat protein
LTTRLGGGAPCRQACHPAPVGALFVSMIVSPDGTSVLATNGQTQTDGPRAPGADRVWVMDAQTGNVTNTIFVGGYVGGLALAPDGKTLAMRIPGGSVNLWDLASNTSLGTLTPGGGLSYFGGVAFSPDGETLAAGYDPPSDDPDSVIVLFDVASKAVIKSLSGVADASLLAISPDGATLASAGYYGGQTWDVGSGSLITTFTQVEVDDMAISPDGRTIVTGGWGSLAGGAVMVWDLGTGEKLGDLTPPGIREPRAFSLALAPGALVVMVNEMYTEEPTVAVELYGCPSSAAATAPA